MSGALARPRRRRVALLPVTLLVALLVCGCVATPAPSTPTAPPSPGSTSPSAATPSPSPTRPSPADTPPPLTRLEVKVIDALARLRIGGRRAELPYQNAPVWAEVATGHLFVYAWPSTTRLAEFRVVGERQIEGVTVQLIEFGGPPVRYRFACSGDVYHVWGAVPPEYQEMDTFVARFIRALGCGA